MAQQRTPEPFRTPDRHRRTTTGAVAVLAGPVPGRREIHELLTERLAPASDVWRRVRRAAVPMPGDDSELFGVIAHALQQPLDPDGPPWECWIIEGLPEDRWAILIRTAEHPGATQLLARLCDGAADCFANPFVAQTVTPAPAPSWTDTVYRAVTGALRPWQAGRPAILRRYRTVVVSRGAVEHVSRRFSVTSEDVALAAITEAYRTVLLQSGERADALRVSGPAPTSLPVEHHDPIQQLRAVSRRTAEPVPDISPFALCVRAIQALNQAPQHSMTLAVAPPGPRSRLRLMDRPLERMLPVPPSPPERGTGVAVLSYGDELIFGITTDYDQAPDAIAAGIERGITRLTAISRDSVVLFDRRRRRRALPNSAARWRPSTVPARVRH